MSSVFTPFGPVQVPQACVKCLTTANLRTYTVKGVEAWSRGSTIYTRKTKLDFPICASCLEEAKTKVRRKYKKRIFAAIASFLISTFAIFIAIVVPAVNYAYGLSIPYFIIAFFLFPGSILLIIYWVIAYATPKGRFAQFWPVKVSPGFAGVRFVFENEKYGEMFRKANSQGERPRPQES